VSFVADEQFSAADIAALVTSDFAKSAQGWIPVPNGVEALEAQA